MRQRPQAVAIGLLLLASMAWGSTFVIVKEAVAQAPVLSFLAWRFILAGVLLFVLRPRALMRLGWRGAFQGGILGLLLATGYILQTVGLKTTPAAISGFLTGLEVVCTPLIAWAMLKHRPGTRTWISIVVATLGLAVMTLRGVAFGSGEVLTLVSVGFFALNLVTLGFWTSAKDAYGLATMEVLTVGAVCLVAAAPSGIGLPASAGVWGAVVVTGVAATAFAFVILTWAQSYLSATTAAIVLTTEPVFAALFAVLSGEHLGAAVLVGGALVVGSMLVLGPGTETKERILEHVAVAREHSMS